MPYSSYADVHVARKHSLLTRRAFISSGTSLLSLLVLTALVWLLRAAPSLASSPTQRGPAAPAAILYASADGPGTAPCTSEAAPCLLQTAVDTAVDGDTILVAAGLYEANGAAQVLWISKTITLLGGHDLESWDRDHQLHPTRLDGASSSRVVYIAGGNSTLDGIIIENGSASQGAGAYVAQGSQPILSNIRFENNQANGSLQQGGALYDAGGATVTAANFLENGADLGGAVFFAASAVAPGLHFSEILSNTAGTFGGGVYLDDNGGASQPLLLEGNIIAHNSSPLGGGVFAATNSNLQVSSNLFFTNTASTDGGAIWSSGSVSLWNNTLADNHSGRTGGALLARGEVTATNNIIAGNTASSSGFAGIDVGTGGAVTGNDNNVYNNINDGEVTLTDTHEWDPAFVNPTAGNYHLLATSGNVDAGDPNLPAFVGLDVDQEPRPYGGGVDIGADEYHPGVPAFTLTPTSDSQEGERGTEVTLHHTLANVGTVADTYTFDCDVDLAGWTLVTCPADEPLAPGETTPVDTVITIPADAPALQTARVIITATSTEDGSLQERAWVDLTVAPQRGVSFTPNYSETVEAGQALTLTHTLTNTGDAPDQFAIAVTSGSWGQLAPDGDYTTASLLPGSSTTVRLVVTVPQYAPAGLANIIVVSATSIGDPDVTASVTDRITARATTGTRYVSTTGTDTDNNCTVPTTANGAPGACRTLTRAIGQAAVGDEIRVAAGTYPESAININNSLRLSGGWNNTFTTQGTPETTIVDGGSAARIFEIAPGGAVAPAIANLTLENGSSAGPGGAIFLGSSAQLRVSRVILDGNNSGADGGAIFAASSSVLTIVESTIRNSNAGDEGGAFYLDNATLSLRASRLLANNAAGDGGAIAGSGTIYATNSLFANNTTSGSGGAWYLVGGTASSDSNTIAGNSAGANGGGFYNDGATLTLHNTLLAENSATSGGAVYGNSGSTSVDFILDSDNSLPSRVGITSEGTVRTGDPQLLVDADYRLQIGSAALDTGGATALDVDFEGDFRPSDQGYDIGWDELAGCRAKRDATVYGSIQDAVDAGGSSLIRVHGTCRGVHTLEVGGETISQTVHLLDQSVHIQGGWNGSFTRRNAPETIVDPEGRGRAFYASGSTASPILEGLTIQNGDATGLGGDGSTAAGGAIYNLDAALVLTDSIVISSTATHGGAIYNQSGSMVVMNAHLAANEADAGGAIYNATAPLHLANTILTANQADEGAGLYNASGAPTIWHNTFYANAATTSGGALHTAGGIPVIRSNIFQDNTAPAGSALFVGGGTPSHDYNHYYPYGATAINVAPGPNSNIANVLPGLVDPAAGDFHLADGAPAVDAGDPASPLTRDFEGDRRPSNQGFDVGADELAGCYAQVGGVIYGSIQEALRHAPDGATVRVAGRCTGVHLIDTTDFGGTPALCGGNIAVTVHITRPVTLQGGWNTSFSAQNANTLLDALGQGRVIYVAPGSNPTVESFEIRGGQATGNGAGICVDNAGATLRDNRIHDNEASAAGGAIFAGGASSALIDGNQISANTAATGGAIALNVTVQTTVQNNFLFDNDATNGGAFANVAGPNRFWHNTVVANSATGSGGGLYVAAGAPNVRNNIVATNSAASGGGAFGVAGSTPALSYNDFYANTPTNYAGTASAGTGSLDVDPQFVSRDGLDYLLEYTSPVVDAGDPTVPVAADFEDDIRPSHQGMDMGADEVGGCYARIVGDPAGTIYGSLQLAVDEADSGATVQFSGRCQGTNTRTVSSTDARQGLFLDKELTVDGQWSYASAGPGEIWPLGRGRGVYVTAGATVTLTHVTVNGGDASTAGYDSDNGGAIYNAGTLHLVGDSQVTQSSATNGGGIYNAGNATIEGSAVHGNNAATGGALYQAGGTLWLDGNRLHGNTATTSGGALYLASAADLRVWNNFIYRNTAARGGAITYALPGSGAILHNTLVANGATTSEGGGLYVASGSVAVTNNIVHANSGTGIHVAAAASATVDYNNVVANIPANYSGVTPGFNNISQVPTYVAAAEDDYHLQPTSAGIDMGIVSAVDHDIDGDLRPTNHAPDMGADELALCLIRVEGQLFGVLQDAIDYAEANGYNLLEVARGECRGVQQHETGTRQVGYVSGDLEIRGSLVRGSFAVSNDYHVYDANSTVFNAEGNGRVLYVAPGADLTLSNVVLVNGNAAAAGGTNDNGGGIYNAGTATFDEINICQSTAENGGAYYAATGSDNIFSGGYSGVCKAADLHTNPPQILFNYYLGNTATGDGGGYYFASGPTVDIRNHGWLVNDAAGSGGGVYSAAPARIVNGIFYANTSGGNGGGIYNTAPLALYHNTFNENSATGDGGAVYSTGALTLNSSIIYNNSATTNGGVYAATTPTRGYNLFFANTPNPASFPLAATTIEADPLIVDAYNLTVDSPAIDEADPDNWQVGVPPNSLVIDFDADIRSRPDRNDYGPYPDDAPSTYNSDIGAYEWGKEFACTVAITPPSRSVQPGETVTYGVTITNTGRFVDNSWRYYTDTLTVTLASSTFGWAGLEGGLDQSFTLAWRESAQRELTVTVPADATAGQIERSVVTCTSLSNPAATGSRTATTIVGLDGGVLVEPDYTTNALPGDVLTFTHTVTNISNQTDTFALTASSGPRHATAALIDESGTIYTPTVTLGIGESTTVILRATILDTATAGDTATPGVVARSTTNPAIEGAALNTINIGYISGTRYVAGAGATDNTNCTDPQNPCATIAHAIDQAVDGDTILVAAGTYAPIVVDKSVTIRGGYSTVDDFTSAQPITRAVYVEDALTGTGAPIVEIAAGTTATLTSLFVEGGDMAGIANHGALAISGTWLLDNAGSALVHDGASLTVLNSVFAGNSADAGGAVHASAGDVTLVNNTFTANTATASGGALYQADGTLALYNNIFSANSSESSPAIVLEGGVSAEYDYNLYDETNIGLEPAANAVTGDPLLVAPYYHLGAGSPAIDTAGATWAPAVDFELQSRPQGIAFDIGADEFTQRAGFDFLPASQTGYVAPGETVTFTHLITNTGDFADTYTLEVTNLPVPDSTGWTVDVTPAGPIALDPGASQLVEVAVTAPAEPGFRNTTTITASSLPAGSAAVHDLAIVTFDAGVAIAPSREGTGLPGDTVTYSHTITNTGTGYDTFTLSLTSGDPAGWPIDVPAGPIALAAGASTDFTVAVHIPADAAASTQHTAEITAVSAGDPSVTATLTDTTTVTAAPQYGVTITPPILTGTGAPGTTVYYTHTVANTGNVADSYTLSATGNTWDTTITPTTLDLAPGASAHILVAVTIPANASDGDDDTATIAVASTASDASAAAADTTSAQVGLFTALVLLPETQGTAGAPGDDVTYTFVVTNTGTAAALIDVSAMSSEPWPVDTSPAFVLGAGESRPVTLTVSIPPGAAPGALDETTLTVAVAGNPAIAASATALTLVRDEAAVPGVTIATGYTQSGIPGETKRYLHTVTNTGTALDVFRIDVEMSLHWDYVLDPTVIPLAPGEQATVTVDVTIPRDATTGTMNFINVEAHSALDPNVTDALENRLIVEAPPAVEWRLHLPIISLATTTTPPPPPPPTPTPTPTATPSPTPTPCTPTGVDLVVTGISVQPAAPVGGEEAIVSVTIRNQGTSDVRIGNNFYVDFYVDRLPTYLLPGDLYWGVQGAWMEAGASRTFSAAYAFSAGSHNLYAMVDTDNSVDECAQEGNNTYGPVALRVSTSALSPGEPAGTAEPIAAPTMLAPRGTPTPANREP